MLAGTGHKAGHENEKPAKKPRLLAEQPSDENSQESIERHFPSWWAIVLSARGFMPKAVSRFISSQSVY